MSPPAANTSFSTQPQKTDYLKVVRCGKAKEKRLGSSYSWETHLRAFEDGSKREKYIPVEAFNTNTNIDFNDILKEGLIFECINHDYDKVTDGVQCRWFARVEKVCGYRVLAQFIASEKKFWINMLTEEIHNMANAALKDPKMAAVTYVPPFHVAKEYENDMQNFIRNALECEVYGQNTLSDDHDETLNRLHDSRFHVGQRLELLNYANSLEIRVARIQEITGRRISVLVSDEDSPVPLDGESDRQSQSNESQYWIDEASFFIFPVGFAAVNGYKLSAKKDYIEHTKRIAADLKAGKPPKFLKEDVTFDDLPHEKVDEEAWSRLKVGQKFELIDPLAQQFKLLHVASIISFCETDGYMIVGMDGPDQLDESFPIHINNTFMFPVGYAEKNGLELADPDSFEGTFKWDEYLEKENAERMPLELFRTEPSEERLNMFQVGMRLEAADMCENQFICPATIKGVHGRIINVNFDGWDEEFDELYDIDSHDILPIGWCELHGYSLQPPKRQNY
ncbi:hypothetical protein GCK72_000181 [Caenorhabditis remanei]|uniref:Uncharacterized protein n=1 Tax=Caenorhabditis remanei TaxID=31234 RepID=A0A6A5HLF3_CAERE|nr:hypothetical protein GCK72_000181 [Caenorhabditis remanei]KAF1768369.1 hypothetical protein GCK72_000181 [Caenorhabditis remanei]